MHRVVCFVELAANRTSATPARVVVPPTPNSTMPKTSGQELKDLEDIQ